MHLQAHIDVRHVQWTGGAGRALHFCGRNEQNSRIMDLLMIRRLYALFKLVLRRRERAPSRWRQGSECDVTLGVCAGSKFGTIESV